MAVFPAGFWSRTPRRNQVDTVDAGDVNSVYDEVVAIERVIGASPQLDLDLNGKRNDYKTVSNRLRYIVRALDKPVIRLESPSESIAKGTGWKDINFDLPDVVEDAFHMFNGIGFTTKRSGWWQLSGDLRWPNTDSTGYRMSSLFANTSELAGTVSNGALDGAGTTAYIRQNFSWQGWLAVGTKITIKASQTSNKTLIATGVTLSGAHTRDGA